MLGLSWAEIFVIVIIAIIFIGPKELPEVLRTIGKFFAKIKEYSNELKEAFDSALEESEIKKTKQKMEEEIKYITDLEGKKQRVYDLDDFLPDFKKDIKKGDKNGWNFW